MSYDLICQPLTIRPSVGQMRPVALCGRSVLSPTERPSHLPRKGLLRKGRVSSPCPSCHPPSAGAHAGLRPPVIPTAPPQHPANRFYPNRL